MNPAPSTTDAVCSVLQGQVHDRCGPNRGSPDRITRRPCIEVVYYSTRASEYDSPWSSCVHRPGLSLLASSGHDLTSGAFGESIQEVTFMSLTQMKPQSGIQLLIIVGAAFLMSGVQTSLGMKLLILGVGMWAIYNIINLGRQF